ncbi:hypothetical protein [Microbacterium sp. A93]
MRLTAQLGLQLSASGIRVIWPGQRDQAIALRVTETAADPG